MIWKSIGKSVIGTSHIVNGKRCEDAIKYGVVSEKSDEVLVCFVSDGAGSAKFAQEASTFVTNEAFQILETYIEKGQDLNEGIIREVAENLYDSLSDKAKTRNVSIGEFSCTLLGAIIYPAKSFLFQIGDGAIVRDDGNENYVSIWPPTNGEYQNTTTFLIDDSNLSNLTYKCIEEPINEIAIFSDGIQLLALSMENNSVHQPFFKDMFKWLRMADNREKVALLNSKLEEYLGSNIINNRTDDDKTLFLATRKTDAKSNI